MLDVTLTLKQVKHAISRLPDFNAPGEDVIQAMVPGVPSTSLTTSLNDKPSASVIVFKKDRHLNDWVITQIE